MPLKYDRDIHAHYHAFVAEGFTRYEAKAATQAAIQLAQGLLDFQPSADFTYQLTIQRIMQGLKDHGIGPRDVLVRIGELAAYMEAHPSTFSKPRAETFAVARLVIHLVPYKLRAATYSPHVLGALGEMTQQACYPFAFALVRRLKADIQAKADLRRLSADLTGT